MENKSYAFAAGLFAILLGMAAILAVWWFGGRHEATREFTVVSTRSITGLNNQGQVRFRGMRVGKVQDIALDRQDTRNILIRISVREDIPMTRAVKARLGYQGLTGIAHVQLDDDGSDPQPLAAGEHIAMQASIYHDISEIGVDTLRNARDFLASANAVLSPENRQNLTKTLANLEATTSRARELMTPANVQRLNAMLANMEKTTAQTEPLLVESRQLIVRLQGLSEKLDAAMGDPASGGVGALATQVNGLARELSANSRQLGRLLETLENSPQSLIYGAPPVPPGPGEGGFSAPASVTRVP